jgi:N,N'-diacetyllegionaminate synthase
MKIGSVDLKTEVLVIAEIGNNHEGSFDVAARMVEAAAKAGAQCVKFQTIAPEKLIAPKDTDRLKQLSRFAFDENSFRQLADIATNNGVMFMSTPFYLEAVDFLEPMVPAFKIASSDNNWQPLLERVARTEKPILLSTGMCALSDVQRAVDIITTSSHASGHDDPEIALLHCISAYPTELQDANLGAIHALASLNQTVGYSDHTEGIEAATLAVAAGARVIEKHFTLDKNFSSFRDHALSADPAELEDLIRKVHDVSKIMGRPVKERLDCEIPIESAARRYAYAARDLRKGDQLAIGDVDWLRSSDGIPANAPDIIVGKTVASNVSKDTRLALEDFE